VLKLTIGSVAVVAAAVAALMAVTAAAWLGVDTDAPRFEMMRARTAPMKRVLRVMVASVSGCS